MSGPHNNKNNQKLESSQTHIPQGLILLVIMISFDILYTMYSYYISGRLFLGFNVTGTNFLIVNSVLLISTCIVLISYITRNYKLIKYAVFHYSFMIVNYVLVIFNAKTLAIATKTQISDIIIMHLGSIFLAIITIIYIFEKKSFFLGKHDDNRSVDNIFITIYLITYFVLLILSIIFSSINLF